MRLLYLRFHVWHVKRGLARRGYIRLVEGGKWELTDKAKALGIVTLADFR